MEPHRLDLVPWLETGKHELRISKTYALGLIPCFALVGTAGFEILTRQRFVRAGIYGLFACWAVGSYLSYFAI